MARLEKRTLLFLIGTPLLISTANATALSVDVCRSCEVTSIGEGVRRAVSGATIRVHPGRYSESNILVSKNLSIIGVGGPEKPVIDAGQNGNIFLVTGSPVVIKGLALQHSGRSYVEEFAAIKAIKANNCDFSDNDLKGNTYGIYLSEVAGCNVFGNKIQSVSESEAQSGNGIHAWKSNAIIAEDNIISGHRDGIYLEFVHNSFISGNTSSQNLRYGLHFMFSHGNEYQRNFFSKNGSGVAVMYSKNIRMTGNTFKASSGPAAYGLLLKDIAAGEIRGNLFSGNTTAVYLEGTTRSVFSGNRLEGNGWAMRVLGDTEGNCFAYNDFVSNSFDVSTNASSNLNRFSGNYWSRYRGLDLDRDGIGDVPYHPVQLSALFIEKYGASVLLLRSFFFAVLDEVESVLPEIVPASYRDESPRMRPMSSP